jgi:hypothetical protein
MKIVLTILLLRAVDTVLAQNAVVVELFTSQGCSSCPAADKNLAEIIENAEANKQQVIGLSFHVDYWNYIGWKDPYSKAEFTERQRKYATHLNSESVYTPQMIVNGEAEFVGSDKTVSRNEIAKALEKKNAFEIVLREVKQTDDKIAVSYSLDKNPTEETINIALVEKNTTNEVTRGENSGRRLAHRNVVRSFGSLLAQKEGVIAVSNPSRFKNWILILYLQNKAWQVRGATSKNLLKSID